MYMFLLATVLSSATIVSTLPLLGNTGTTDEVVSANPFGCEPGMDTCSGCYSVLFNEVFINDRNRYNLQRAFFPADNTNPVFVTVRYYFTRNMSGNGSTDYSLTSPSEIWYWTQSTFYLFQPIFSLEYTSLLFTDTSLRESKISLFLQPDCLDADSAMMELFTQRVSTVQYCYPMHARRPFMQLVATSCMPLQQQSYSLHTAKARRLVTWCL